MPDLNALLHNPLAMYVIFWVLSGAAQTMPAPRENSGLFYVWVHDLFQFFLANIPRMRQFNPPAK